MRWGKVRNGGEGESAMCFLKTKEDRIHHEILGEIRDIISGPFSAKSQDEKGNVTLKLQILWIVVQMDVGTGPTELSWELRSPKLY